MQEVPMTVTIGLKLYRRKKEEEEEEEEKYSTSM
jgi:hypothetical protein